MYVPSSGGFAAALGEPSARAGAASLGTGLVCAASAAARLLAGGALVGVSLVICGGVTTGTWIGAVELVVPGALVGGANSFGLLAAAFGAGFEFDGTVGFVASGGFVGCTGVVT